jgi:subtilisin family serine protease
MDPGPDGLVEPGRWAVSKDGPHRPGTEDRLWALKKINCIEAWNLPPAGGAAKGAGSLVAQPDTGFTDHPELGDGALDLVRDWDVLQGDDDAHDPLERRPWNRFDSPGHGTSTASVVVSREELDVTGAAPRARVVPVRAIRSVVQVSDGDVARAVDHARVSGCHVISMSLGGAGFYDGLGAAIRRAVHEGLIVCAAAGNYVGFVVAPARFPECIAVAATNIEDGPWKHSSRGPEVDISAPGESVWVADIRLEESPPRYDVRRHSGTSFAVTHLGGVAALWLAHHRRQALLERYGPENLQAAFLYLVTTAGNWKPPNWDSNNYGAGIVDAHALLKAPLPDREEIGGVMPPWPSPLEKLNGVVPQLSREELARRLADLLHLQHVELPERLGLFGAELAYLLTEHADLRIRLWASEPGPDLAYDLARVASPTLARQLAAHDR